MGIKKIILLLFIATIVNAQNITKIARVGDIIKVVNVEKFGAVNDGVTDNATAIQNAINSVGNDTILTIVFNEGIYKVDTTINLRSNLILKGYGAELDFSALSNTESAFKSSSSISNLRIEDIKLIGNGANSSYTSHDGILLTGASKNIKIKDVKVDKFVFGINISPTSSNVCKYLTVKDCQFDSNSYAAVRLENTSGANIEGNTIVSDRTGIGDGIDEKVGIWLLPKQAGETGNYNARIVNNIFYGGNDESINNHGKYSIIMGNTFYNVYTAIICEPFLPSGNSIEDTYLYTLIAENTIDSSGGYAIALRPDPVNNSEGISGCIVSNNIMRNVKDGIMIGYLTNQTIDSYDNMVIGNKIIHSSGMGIYVGSAHRIGLYFNDIDSSSMPDNEDGIGIGDSSSYIRVLGGHSSFGRMGAHIYEGANNITIESVEFAENYYYGVQLSDGAHDVSIINNTFVNNTGDQGTGIDGAGTQSNIEIRGNNYVGSQSETWNITSSELKLYGIKSPLKLENTPTTKPTTTNAVWDSAGYLKIVH